MRVELLYIAECPNYREAARMLKETLREYGFRDEVSETQVTDAAHARALGFLGSPSIRIDGKDIESIAPTKRDCGLSCRTYLAFGRRSGVPPLSLIRAAISSARMEAQKNEAP